MLDQSIRGAGRGNKREGRQFKASRREMSLIGIVEALYRIADRNLSWAECCDVMAKSLAVTELYIVGRDANGEIFVIASVERARATSSERFACLSSYCRHSGRWGPEEAGRIEWVAGGLVLQLTFSKPHWLFAWIPGVAELCARERDRCVQSLQRLASHLQRLVTVRMIMADMLERAAIAERMGDRPDGGIIAVDDRGNVRHVGAHTTELIGDAGLATICNSRISFAEPLVQREFDKCLERVRTDSPGEGRLLKVTGAVNGRVAKKLAISFFSVELPPAEPHLAARRGILILIRDPSRRAPIDLRSLQEDFGLTRAEARVSAELSAGRDLPEAATNLGIALTTARTHLQNVYRKVGVRSRVGLANCMEAYKWPILMAPNLSDLTEPVSTSIGFTLKRLPSD